MTNCQLQHISLLQLGDALSVLLQRWHHQILQFIKTLVDPRSSLPLQEWFDHVTILEATVNNYYTISLILFLTQNLRFNDLLAPDEFSTSEVPLIAPARIDCLCHCRRWPWWWIISSSWIFFFGPLLVKSLFSHQECPVPDCEKLRWFRNASGSHWVRWCCSVSSTDLIKSTVVD